MNPATMSNRKLVEYLAHVGKYGFSLVYTQKGYELVANTGQLVPFDGVAIIERELASLKTANVLVQADLARLELMMDSMLAEEEMS